MDPVTVKDGFLQTFYNTMQTKQANMGPELFTMYHPEAIFTSEGNEFKGPQGITEKHISMFGTHMFAITTSDVQRIDANKLVIMVVGQLQDLTSDKPLGFHHTFVLQDVGNGMLITNEIFRVSVHNF